MVNSKLETMFYLLKHFRVSIYFLTLISNTINWHYNPVSKYRTVGLLQLHIPLPIALNHEDITGIPDKWQSLQVSLQIRGTNR